MYTYICIYTPFASISRKPQKHTHTSTHTNKTFTHNCIHIYFICIHIYVYIFHSKVVAGTPKNIHKQVPARIRPFPNTPPTPLNTHKQVPAGIRPLPIIGCKISARMPLSYFKALAQILKSQLYGHFYMVNLVAKRLMRNRNELQNIS